MDKASAQRTLICVFKSLLSTKTEENQGEDMFLTINGYDYRLFGVVFIKEEDCRLSAWGHLGCWQVAGNRNILKVDLITGSELDSSRIVPGVKTF
jgi:hypothetical protein